MKSLGEIAYEAFYVALTNDTLIGLPAFSEQPEEMRRAWEAAAAAAVACGDSRLEVIT